MYRGRRLTQNHFCDGMGFLPIYGNALRTQECACYFSIIVVDAFKYFIHKFLEVYFDDWEVYGIVKYHIESLRMMLDQCR